MRNSHTLIYMRTVSLAIFVMLALTLALPAWAQNGSSDERTQTFTQEQLAQLLAPIALYPDELITQVLLASTYPLEIVMADRWVQQNKDLKDNALASALERENWDPSVKALVNFPTVLAMLSQKLDLTTKLGDAFLEQKEDVMTMIQQLRKKAAEAGNLKSTMEQKVIIEEDRVLIEPVDTRVVYVPIYDPYVVYGPWWYPAYPPYYFYPRPYSGVVFSFGIGVTLGLPWGYAWSGWDWYNRTVYINVNRNLGYNRYIDRSRYIRHYERRGVPIRNGQVLWQHDPGHRRGVAYKDKVTARKFGQLPARTGETRRESRGYITPGRTAPGTGGSGVALPPDRKVIIQPEGAERKTRRGTDVTSPKPTRDSAFTEGYSDGSRIRRFSERGSQSIDGSNVFRGGSDARPGRESSPGSSRGSGINRSDGRRR